MSDAKKQKVSDDEVLQMIRELVRRRQSTPLAIDDTLSWLYTLLSSWKAERKAEQRG